ncbi:MAG: ABC transporter permease [Erysipelotrichaceae bacterium]|nr:ABC transporter permease [Erysipelotrichaceae bacterium]MCB9500221.1 ABC transporter permease [Erysipelotrichaceae bacterium]
MRKYILQRVVLIFFTAFVILSLTFILIKLLPPGTPAGFPSVVQAFYIKQVGNGYMLDFSTAQTGLGNSLYNWVDTSGLAHYIYNKPVMSQYFSWLANIFTKWDRGTSTNVSVNQSAMVIILERLPVTIEINLLTSAIAVPIGFGLGIWAALKKNTVTDGIISTIIMIFISIPSFISITFLIMIFAYNLHWLPSQWPSVLDSASVRAAGFVIPVFALSMGTICAYARWVRAELCEVMSSEFLLLARTKGLTRGQTIVRHALRNSLVPIFPMLIGEIIGALSGSMILEQLYGIPGIGRLYIQALGDPGKTTDYNVLMVDMALVTMIGLFASLLVDLSYGFVDPRIRMGAKK